MKNKNKPRTKNSAWENIDLFIQKKLEADSRLIDYQRARTRTGTRTRKSVSLNSDYNIENLISEEAPKKKKDNNESNDNNENNDDNDNYDNNEYNDNNNVSLIVETSPKKKRRMDDDNDNSIKLSREKILRNQQKEWKKK